MCAQPLWAQQQPAEEHWRPVSLLLPPRDDWLAAQLPAGVCGQLRLSIGQGLHQQKVPGPLSWPVRYQRQLQCAQPCADLYLHPWICRRSLLTVQ